jgi:hypothetical protein
MTMLDILERQAARVERFGIQDLLLSAPTVPEETLESEVSGDLVNHETLERGVAYLREDSEARKRALSLVVENLAAFPERLKPEDLLRDFEALLDIYTGSGLKDWQERWAERPIKT